MVFDHSELQKVLPTDCDSNGQRKWECSRFWRPYFHLRLSGSVVVVLVVARDTIFKHVVGRECQTCRWNFDPICRDKVLRNFTYSKYELIIKVKRSNRTKKLPPTTHSTTTEVIEITICVRFDWDTTTTRLRRKIDMFIFCSRRIASNGSRRARYVLVGSWSYRSRIVNS